MEPQPDPAAANVDIVEVLHATYGVADKIRDVATEGANQREASPTHVGPNDNVPQNEMEDALPNFGGNDQKSEAKDEAYDEEDMTWGDPDAVDMRAARG